jgi:hypothetical protein
MDETPERTISHLTRLCRFLLAGGLVSLAIATFLQWDQWQSGGRLGDGYEVALMAQLLMVLGTVALTGAVFGYVLLAVRRDREQSSIKGKSADASWYE